MRTVGSFSWIAHRVMPLLVAACRQQTSLVRRSIPGFIPQFIAASAARCLLLHQLSVSRSSCYFVIVALSPTADESNATLKTVTGSVNNTGLNKRVQFVIPFPKADYHRNRLQLRFAETICHYGIFIYWLTFHMNFTQLQERLRVELLRRIDRGSVNGAVLARQTGFQPSHISNFLRRRRTLSLGGLDRLLAAQMLTVGDLLALDDMPPGPREAPNSLTHTAIPVVAPSVAIHDPVPPSSATLDTVQLPLGILEQIRSRRATSRRGWSRFVSVRVTRLQATGMQPLLPPDTLAVIDRHYNSPVAYQPPQPSIFAVRVGNALQLRLTEFENNRLILRPIELDHPVQLLALGPHEMPSDLIIGRVCLILAPIP